MHATSTLLLCRIYVEVCSLTKRCGAWTGGQLLNKQPVAREPQTLHTIVPVEAKSGIRLTKQHADDAKAALSLLIIDLRHIEPSLYASSLIPGGIVFSCSPASQL